MDTIEFGQLPFLAKFSSLLALFLAWVAFAEIIIDRHGWDKFLPYYRVGNFCPYDVAVIGLLVAIWIALRR